MTDNTTLLFEDALQYLGEKGIRKYVTYMCQDQRRGQAWFNALHEVYPGQANVLRGSLADPFFKDDKAWRLVLLGSQKK
mgnify:CR=1 FL=1